MRQLRITLVMVASLACAVGCAQEAGDKQLQNHTKADLEKALANIQKDPNSSFWHNQAGISYDAAGDFENAQKEFKLASTLDADNPIHDYFLYNLYKRRQMRGRERKALLSALEKDSGNPLGNFELGALLENEGHLAESLKQYRSAKLLVVNVKGNDYVDRRANPYDIRLVRRTVDECVSRVAVKLKSSAERETGNRF